MTHALSPGTVLKSPTQTYIIRSVLGQGGFGITYSASFSTTVNGQPVMAIVAIKEHFIQADCERGASGHSVSYSMPARNRVESSRKDFASEARRLKQLAPGSGSIVQVSEIFDSNNTSYYVMEYLEGITLADYVKQHGPLSEAETMSIMSPIIKATGYLHANRVTHLDIKPANIMLSRNHEGGMRPVLIDFGLSKHYNPDGSATSTINTQGFSDGYAPVEQYGGISSFSPTSDVYSLSATMLYCLTAKRPPRALELYPHTIGSLIPAHLSANLKNALTSSLSMNPAARPANANTLLQQLGAATASTQSMAESPNDTTILITPKPINTPFSQTPPSSSQPTNQTNTLESNKPVNKKLKRWTIAYAAIAGIGALLSIYTLYWTGSIFTTYNPDSDFTNIISDLFCIYFTALILGLIYSLAFIFNLSTSIYCLSKNNFRPLLRIKTSYSLFIIILLNIVLCALFSIAITGTVISYDFFTCLFYRCVDPRNQFTLLNWTMLICALIPLKLHKLIKQHYAVAA